MSEEKQVKMSDVKSSNVEAVGHDGTDMHVRFKGGAIYVYAGVPKDEYDLVLAAESVGRALGPIKSKYPATKKEDRNVHQGKPDVQDDPHQPVGGTAGAAEAA